MLIAIFLLILVCTIKGKPVGKLMDKVKDVNWSEITSSAWNGIRSFGRKAGRATCTPLLYFYYVMSAGDTTLSDKALIYGAILYIITPFDLLPRKVLGLLGVLDDAAVIAFVYKRISGRITPEIEAAVKATLDEWFGATPAIG